MGNEAHDSILARKQSQWFLGTLNGAGNSIICES